MEIKSVKIKELKPYEKNPRRNDEAVKFVASSIKEFGFKVPIIVDKDMIIIAGHTQYKAAKRLKLKEVPVIMADDLTDEQVKAFRLADNKVAERSEWDFDLLTDELTDILDIDMEQFGFEFDGGVEDEVQEDDFEIEPPKEPKAKLGDIYQLGRHRLMCGDSTNVEDVEKLMNGSQADLLLTDPPYNVDYEGKTKEALKIENDHMGDDSFYQFLYDIFTNACAVMKDGASFYVWYASKEVVNFTKSITEAGLTVKQELIWNKNSMVMGRQDYQWKHEPCLYGWKETASHNWYSDRKQTTVIDIDRPTRNSLHPTMKPITLFDYLIKNSSKKGDAILDLFMGSGTTLMACEQNNRIAYGMEFDPKYVDVIVERWEQFTGEKAVRIDSE